MTVLWQSPVTRIGDDAAEMIEAGVLILFGEPVPDALADAILAQLTAMRTVLTDPVEWLAEYRRRCVNLGRPVRVLRGNTVRQATALAIDEQFGLTVQYENGETETVRSGEVSVRGLYGYIE